VKAAKVVKESAPPKIKKAFPTLPNDDQPFINTLEMERVRQEKEALEPSNLDLIELQKAFSGILPERMQPKQKEVREFLLNDLMPFSLAVQNGTLDAFDVARRTLNEEVQGDNVSRTIRTLTVDAINLKLLTFVSKIAELTPEEARLLLASHLLRASVAIGGGNNVIEQIMSSLRQFSNVQRQEEERNVPVRQLPGAKKRRQRGRPVQPTPGAEEPKPPSRRYSNRRKSRKPGGRD
jgi:hypothetical protein